MPKKDETTPDSDEKKSEITQADQEKRTRESGKHFQAQGTEKQG